MNRQMALEWLKAARDDLMVIEEISDNELLTHMIAFHSQQALEKVFKAMIEYRMERVPKQHDLLLLQEKVGADLPNENEDILEALNELYIESRYPGSLGLLPNGKPTQAEALEFYIFVKKVFEQACRVLKIVSRELSENP